MMLFITYLQPKEKVCEMKLEQIGEILDLSVEGVDYLAMAAQRKEEDREARDVLRNLRQIAAHLEKELVSAQGLSKQIYLYAKNVQASIDDLSVHPDLYERIIQMEIRPFIMEMQRLWTLDTEVLATEEGRSSYRQCVMERVQALHHGAKNEYKYDVSILLLAYNKLEYTKLAAESILRYTEFSKGNIELVLLNNGSGDGTREYFEGLPYTKIINLRHNIMGVYAYTHLLEGKYFVGFSNDVIATPHWLEHMLTCMESDDHIAMAVPVCNEGSISNNQGVPVPYANTFEGMEEMQAFAAEYNHLNPLLWEDRSQLMPFISIVRMELQKMGAADPIYTRAEFMDDDVSTLLRRNGWRQILLKDTFMHHFGGVTLGADRYSRANNALGEMRRVYYDKWGVDAWESRGGFVGLENVQTWHDFRADERVLILEPRFGDLACGLLNEYRRRGFVPHMTAAVFDERYLPDTNYIFDETLTVRSISDVGAQCEGRYNIISAGGYLDELPLGDVIADLERLYALLAPGGIIILPVRNPGSAYELDCMMHAGTRDVYESKAARYAVIPYRRLLESLHAHPLLHTYQIHVISMAMDDELVRRMKPLLRHDEDAPADLEMSLSVRMFFLGISKQ